MYIHEAVKKAQREKGVIYRTSIKSKEQDRYAVIKPTNSYDCCIAIICNNGKTERSARAWNPTADDLAADDWEYLRDEFGEEVH